MMIHAFLFIILNYDIIDKYINVFEIDKYIKFDKQLVVAIDIDKDNVDKVYSELKKIND